MMSSFVLFLFISSVALQVYGQDVEIRGTNEKLTSEGGGQTRNIYSQRHLSPHRMMHFGRKKAIRTLPPLILSPQVYDLNQQQGLQQQLLPTSMLDRLPYLFSVQLDHGQTLEELPKELSDRDVYSFEQGPQINFRPLHLSEQQPLNEQKFMRLMNGGNEATDNSANNNDEKASSEEDDQQPAISVSTRSTQSSRANTLSLPKHYISSIMYNQQGSSSSSMPSFGGSYNKKAEPSKDNFFMHFGRK